MAQKLCNVKIELVGDETEVNMLHVGEQQEDGYFAEVIEFDFDINGMGARMTIPISDEEDRKAIMKGLVRLHNSLKAHAGKQDLVLDE
jgi:hypothetical protein